jgi:hypothetical protein
MPSGRRASYTRDREARRRRIKARGQWGRVVASLENARREQVGIRPKPPPDGVA